MRCRWKYLANATALTLLGCSGGNNGSPVEPHPDAIASIKISLPAGRINVMAISDTVTLTATVRDRTGNRVDNGMITWIAQPEKTLVITGPRTALLTIARGSNDIKVSIAEKYFSNPFSATISLLGNTPPEVFIWNPGGVRESVPVPSDAEGIVPGTLSDRGEVVGTVFHSGSGYAAFVWSSAAGFREIDASHDSEAKGMSGSGAILGAFGDGIGGFGRPFLWKTGSSPEQIKTMPLSSFAIDINTAGHVAGGYIFDAFLWTSEKGLVFITNSSDTIHSHAIALNDRDDILVNTGRATATKSSLDVPGIWSGGVLTALGCQTCVAHDINNGREVVVSVDGHAFLWRAESGVMRLPTPAGTTSDAVAINNKGDVAGWVREGELTQAAIWTDSGSKLVLPLAGLRSTASAINNLGQVVVVRSF